jgi:hypothetical protein
MSFDRQIDQLCPHQVIDETLFVDSTRQIVRPIKPIASLASVNLRLNGLLDIPPQGVAIATQVTGTQFGPFNVTAGVNDTLVVRVNSGPTQTVVVPPSTQIPPDKLAGLLNFGLTGCQFNVVNGAYLQLQSAGVGYASTVWIDGASTLGPTIGFLTNHLYRGVNVTPGWALILDPSSLPELPYRMVFFDQPLRSVGDYVELSYSTVRTQCRRCGGTGVEDDWRYGYNGDTGEVRDEALLIQEIEKIMFTIRGTNPFHTWYGTTINETVGRKIAFGNFVQNLIVSDVTTTFNRWQSIKNQQQQVVRQYVSDKEYPYRLLSVVLQQSTQDPTVIYLNATISNRSQQPIQISRGISLPQPLNLLGATQQQAIAAQMTQLHQVFQ